MCLSSLKCQVWFIYNVHLFPSQGCQLWLDNVHLVPFTGALDNVPHGTAHICTEWTLDTVHLYNWKCSWPFLCQGVALFFLSYRCGCNCSVGFWLISQTRRLSDFQLVPCIDKALVKLYIFLPFPMVWHRTQMYSHSDYLAHGTITHV